MIVSQANRHVLKLKGLSVLLWCLCLRLVCPLSATENHWTGNAEDNLWSNPTNWSLAVVPDSSQDVVITNTGTNAVLLDTLAEVTGFKLGIEEEGASLNIVGSGELHCSGDTLIESNSVINLAGILSAEIPANSGSSFIVKGTINWTEGRLGAFEGTKILIWPLLGRLNISGTGQKILDGKLQNVGTISCYADSLQAGNFARLVNEYRLMLYSNLTLAEWGTDAQFRNTGTILVPPDCGQVSLTITPAWSFTNLSNLQDFPFPATLRAESNSVLELTGQYEEWASFEDGTVFDGAGMVRFPPLNLFRWNGILTLNCVMEYASGAYGTPYWTGSGVFKWMGGGMENYTFGPDFHVEMLGNDYKNTYGPCTNYGVIRWLGDATFYPGFDARFYNYGQFIIETNCMLGEFDTGVFNNFGAMLIPANKGTATLVINWNWIFRNHGTINVETNSVLALSAAGGFINYGTFEAKTNAILQLSGDISFNHGTVFTGDGIVRLDGGPMTANATLTVNGTVELSSVSLSGTHTWTGPGTLNWLSGYLWGSGTTTLDTNFHLNFVGDFAKYLEEHTLVNYGTVTWNSSGTSFPIPGLYGTSDTLFINHGLFLLQTNCYLNDSGVFLNTGTIRQSADSGLLTIYANMSLTNTGVLEAETNAVLQLAGNVAFDNGTAFNGNGIVRLDNGPMTASGTLTVNGTVELSSVSLSGTHTWTGPGTLNWLSGYLWGSGTTTLDANFHLNFAGDSAKYLEEHTLINYGTVTWNSSGSSFPTPGFYGTSNTRFINHGLFLLQTNCYLNDEGSFSNAVTGIFKTAGHIANVAWSFDNDGGLNLSPGILNLNNGNYAPGPDSVEVHTLAGHAPGTEYGRLAVNNLTPAGTLVVALTNGFTPTNGCLFVLASYSTHTGAFPSIQLPQLTADLVWKLDYTDDNLVASVVSPAQFSALAYSVDGSFQFTFAGPSGGACVIEASTNLTGWTVIVSNSPFTGSLNFTDTNAASFKKRFYRGLILE